MGVWCCLCSCPSPLFFLIFSGWFPLIHTHSYTRTPTLTSPQQGHLREGRDAEPAGAARVLHLARLGHARCVPCLHPTHTHTHTTTPHHSGVLSPIHPLPNHPLPNPTTEEKAGSLDLARRYFRKALECKSRSIPTLVALAQLEGGSVGPLAVC